MWTTVGDAMLRGPKVSLDSATVGDVRAVLDDERVHAALLVDDGVLVSVVDRDDLGGAPDDGPARSVGRLADRVTGPDADLDATWQAMAAAGRRRLAVVDDDLRLLGLLCLKRRGQGFCSDADVDARD